MYRAVLRRLSGWAQATATATATGWVAESCTARDASERRLVVVRSFWFPWRRGTLGRAEARRVALRLAGSAGFFTYSRVYFILLGGFFMLCGLGMARNGRGFPLLYGGAMTVIAGAWTTLALLAFPSHDGEEIADAMLAEGLCPSCGYSIEGLVADERLGCECPECGGRWRITTPRPGPPIRRWSADVLNRAGK